MLRQEWSEKLDKWMNRISTICSVAVLIIGATLKVDSNYYQSPLLVSILSGLKNSAWFSVFTLTIFGAGAQIVRSQIGSPVIWQTVQFLLDQYWEEMFGKGTTSSNDPKYFHRITLFKHVRWHWGFVRWPWSGWMIPVARSSYVTRSRIARFCASENDPDNAEGIAGQAWARGCPVQVHGLPDINSESSTGEELDEYARKGLVAIKWLERRKRKKKAHALSLLVPCQVEIDG